jgi:hypothetical protein
MFTIKYFLQKTNSKIRILIDQPYLKVISIMVWLNYLKKFY